MPLDFQGPYHFNQIAINPLPFRIKQAIYIWGFLYQNDPRGVNSLGDIINGEIDFEPNTMKFIPHYVGMVDKKFLSIRLNEHHAIGMGQALKYKRLSLCYMKLFINDPHFPIYTQPIDDVNNFIIARRPDRPIEYFNRPAVLGVIYPGIIPNYANGGWPIDVQNYPIGHHLHDTLSDYIVDYNNFWFCYAIPEEPEVNLPLNYLEAYTFWSLKGNTISEVDFHFDKLHTRVDFIGPNAHLFLPPPANNWPGYV